MGTFSITGKTAIIDFSGGTAVRDFVAASSSDDLVSFYVVRNTLQPDGGNSYIHAIATREHATVVGPQLELNQIPEPSSLALAAASLLGLLGFTRRRRT